MYSPSMPPLVDFPSGSPPFIPPPGGGAPNFFAAFPGAQESQQQSAWPSQPQSAPAANPHYTPAWTLSGGQPIQNWPHPGAGGTTPIWPAPTTPVWGQTPATAWPSAQAQPATPATAPVGWVNANVTPNATWGNASASPHTPASGLTGYPAWATPQQAGQHSPYHGVAIDPHGRPLQLVPPTQAWPAAPAGPSSAPPYAMVSGPPAFLTPAPTKPKRRKSVNEGKVPKSSIMKRTNSFGGAAEMGWVPPYGTGDVFDENNLARRPRDWRLDYSPRGAGLSSVMNLVSGRKSDVPDYIDPTKRHVHPLLLFAPNTPPIEFDLRKEAFHPQLIEFLNLERPTHEYDFAQLALKPTCSFMRLYHPKLPWYIDVHQTHPNGVTVYDVLASIHRQLQTPIQPRHFYNEELTASDRAGLARTFQERCQSDLRLVSKGVLQVDFLGHKFILEGLARGPKGMWELKTTTDE